MATKTKARRGRGEDSVYQMPDGSWEGAISLGADPGTGRRRRKKVRRPTKAEVLTELKRLRAGGADGLVVGPKDRLTLGAWLDRWLADVAAVQVRPKTLQSYRLVVEKHIRPFLGAAAVAVVTPATLQGYLASRARAGAASRQMQIALVVLRQALDNARRMGLVVHNVCADVDAPKHQKGTAEVLDLAGAKALLAAAWARSQGDGALLEIAIDTGARQGELFGMQWGDIDLAAGRWTVDHNLVELTVAAAEEAGAVGQGEVVAAGLLLTETPKTDDGRRAIDLSARAADVLREHHERAGRPTTGFVFTGSRGSPLRNRNFGRVLRDLLDAAGLPEITFHALRHTTATVLLDAGLPAHVVSRRLGHRDVATTLRIYAHVLRAAEQRASAVMGDLLADGSVDFRGRANRRANGANKPEHERTQNSANDVVTPESEAT